MLLHASLSAYHDLDWFDVLDDDSLPLLTERQVLRNLQAIVSDADTLDRSEVARKAMGVLSTENRKIWSGLRKMLQQDRNNAGCLQIVDRALFVVCLDDTSPESLADLCSNFLCGTYSLQGGEQVGTCTNRWYDKVQEYLLIYHLATYFAAAANHCLCRWVRWDQF